jgi:CheY-like chemotaxis protein
MQRVRVLFLDEAEPLCLAYARRILRPLLDSTGVSSETVLSVEAAAEAIAAQREARWFILAIDGQGKGLALTALVRESMPREHAHIMLFTSKGRLKSSQCLASGADDCIEGAPDEEVLQERFHAFEMIWRE